MKTNLYVAYGSNLCMDHMAARCPGAQALGTSHINDMRLIFRHVADVIHAKGYQVPVGVWRITRQCEAALDRYEGVKGGLYRKEYVTFPKHGPALIYMMNSTGIMPPSEFYLDTIREGYGDFGLNTKPLDAAVRHASREARMTQDVLERRQRRLKNDPRNQTLAWSN